MAKAKKILKATREKQGVGYMNSGRAMVARVAQGIHSAEGFYPGYTSQDYIRIEEGRNSQTSKSQNLAWPLNAP